MPQILNITEIRYEYLFNKMGISLDQVVGLGDFLEIVVVLKEYQQEVEGEKNCQ